MWQTPNYSLGGHTLAKKHGPLAKHEIIQPPFLPHRLCQNFCQLPRAVTAARENPEGRLQVAFVFEWDRAGQLVIHTRDMYVYI